MTRADRDRKRRVRGGESLPESFMGHELVVTGWMLLYDAVEEAEELAKCLQMPVKHSTMKQPSQFVSISIVKCPLNPTLR